MTDQANHLISAADVNEIDRKFQKVTAEEVQRAVEARFEKRARRFSAASLEDWQEQQSLRQALTTSEAAAVFGAEPARSALDRLISRRESQFADLSQQARLQTRPSEMQFTSDTIEIVFDIQPSELWRKNATYKLYVPPYFGRSSVEDGVTSPNQKQAAIAQRNQGFVNTLNGITRTGGNLYAEACLWLRFGRTMVPGGLGISGPGYAQIRPFFLYHYKFAVDSYFGAVAQAQGWLGIWVQSTNIFGGDEQVDLDWRQPVFRSRLNAGLLDFDGEHSTNPNTPDWDSGQAFTWEFACPVFRIWPDRIYFAAIYVANQVQADGASLTNSGFANASLLGQLDAVMLWQTKL